jgi:hypothetical protein
MDIAYFSKYLDTFEKEWKSDKGESILKDVDLDELLERLHT